MAEQASTKILTNDDLAGRDEIALRRFWLDQLESADQYFRYWEHEGDRIYQRYRDERGMDERGITNTSWRLATGQQIITKRYNILWSNVQTMFPALYSQMPKPMVNRRYKDRDPMARLAAEINERLLAYLMDTGHEYGTFDKAMQWAVLSYLLPGRATSWVRYEAEFETIREEVEAESEDGEVVIESTESEVKTGERVCFEDVYFRDFRHSPFPTLDEVWARGWVARRHAMTMPMLRDRFGAEKAGKTRLTIGDKETHDLSRYSRTNEKTPKDGTHAEVWEIWNKPTGTVYWVSDGYADGLLDEREDFLNLVNFFPCPRPMFASQTPEKTIPIPDYRQYHDQASNLDRNVTKVHLLTTALRIAGFYPGEKHQEFQQLFDGVDRNTMIPINDWSWVQGQGGLKGIVEYAPLEQVVQALQGLYQSIEDNKQQIYEIIGISDIMRGASKASETLGAQRIKGQFGVMRMSDRQRAVAEYARDLLRIAGEISLEHFDIETIAEMVNFSNSAYGQDPQNRQLFMQAIQLLKDDKQRSYRVDVETNSTVFADEQQEKEQRIEFVTAVGGFFEKALPIMQTAPEMGPLIGEMLGYAVRGFRAGRELEDSVDEFVEQMQRRAEQAQRQPQQPSPEELEAQANAQLEQQKMAIDGQYKQGQLALEARGQNVDLMKARMQAQQGEQDSRRSATLKLVDTIARQTGARSVA